MGADGVKPSSSKVEAIRVWPEVLHNDTQVRQLLGTVNYCRMFMGPEFVVLAEPLVALTRKGVVFEWRDEHTEAVRALKERLINYTTLQIPDPRKPFILRTDASGVAIGAVLEQEGKPVGFLSAKMSDAERRYSTYEQELLAIVRALQRWRTLLLPAKVTVLTDHQALKHLMKLKADKTLEGRAARWLNLLALFNDLTIEYRPGQANVVADALSRCPLYVPGTERGSLLEPQEFSTQACVALTAAVIREGGAEAAPTAPAPAISDPQQEATLVEGSAAIAAVGDDK